MVERDNKKCPQLQHTHAAIWAIIAFTKLGMGEKAHEFFRMINPIEHSRTKEAAQKYKVEPYVVAADVYSENSLAGRGGWTWYTGSSSWMYKAGLEYILGFKKQGNKLKLEPCIPSNWEEYSIRYKYGETIYNINVKNPKGESTKVEKVIIDNNIQEDKTIYLIDDNNIHNVEVIM